MNKKEVAELKRRFKKDQATFSRMVACYVDGNHNKICKFGGKFLTLEEEEYYKYLEIANKVLSGKLGNNLLNLEFPLKEEVVGGRQQILMALRDSELEDETLLDTWYDLVIDTYEEAGNYLIILYLDSYDVMTRTRDQIDLDESEEVYKYLLCAICPVALSKPALGYLEEEQRIGSRIRDWVVGLPDTGFLFPAFNDRSTDIHSTLFYTKNTKEPHSEFMTNGLGCGVEHTATEQKMAFHSIIRNALGAEDEHTNDVLLDIQATLSEKVEEYTQTHEEDADPFILDKPTIREVLSDCHVDELQQQKIDRSLDEAFGDKLPAAENVIDSKALAANEVRIEKLALEEQLGEMAVRLAETTRELESYTGETKEDAVVVHMSPERAADLGTQVIDGKRYLLIPLEEDETANVNGESLEL